MDRDGTRRSPFGVALFVAGSGLACGSSSDDSAAARTLPTATVWENISPPISFDPTLFSNGNYGTQTIVAAPSDPSVVYLGTCNQGIWRTVDGGDSWTKINTGTNGANLDTGRNWTLTVDPTDADTVYTVSGFGQEQGIWKSVDGGVSWRQILPTSVSDQTTADIYSLALNPDDPSHPRRRPQRVGRWIGLRRARDTRRRPVVDDPPAAGHLGYRSLRLLPGLRDVAGDHPERRVLADRRRRSELGAGHDRDMVHGGNQLYRTEDGTIYSGAVTSMLRSTDEGRTWSESAQRRLRGTTWSSETGSSSTRSTGSPASTRSRTTPVYVSREDDGARWTPLNPDQVFENGPMSMTFDPESRTMYSSNWNAGVWRLRL